MLINKLNKNRNPIPSNELLISALLSDIWLLIEKDIIIKIQNLNDDKFSIENKNLIIVKNSCPNSLKNPIKFKLLIEPEISFIAILFVILKYVFGNNSLKITIIIRVPISIGATPIKKLPIL